ncbi:anaerobic ribonucleoside-triphosphate reductase activating protein [Thermincola ferriacetica]|uniref:Anaerobic ribonucleoside-triphosphate reductase-activating protein n=1 Tax=Thermincola ferriacetica TaxID=281456 RepID=A0A0L6W5T4_9FIRM|nr:anaerobic ribonucleoside-triphosphate reductase activating protein [Thermincola ferriacetica]KNZ70449.1 anaerobic ribonucleoside-triphosphate reductase activating protein [Thermincola ferriacetica]
MVMKIRLAGLAKESVVDGPGLRSVVFAQGCPRRCPGCHNPDALDPDGGQEVDIDEIVSTIVKNPLVKGVTFSGGDPFLQAAGFAALAGKLKDRGLNILTFTGYTWEELLALSERDKNVKKLIELSDIIIDGPFIEAEKDLNLAFRGSRNQRIIDVKKSLESDKIVEMELN